MPHHVRAPAVEILRQYHRQEGYSCHGSAEQGLCSASLSVLRVIAIVGVVWLWHRSRFRSHHRWVKMLGLRNAFQISHNGGIALCQPSLCIGFEPATAMLAKPVRCHDFSPRTARAATIASSSA
jgi:hypothetical protein